MSNKMKNMRTVLFMLFAAISLSISAQSVTLTGSVKDKTGEPIIGASILEKGTSNGIITDMDGNFTLKVSGAKPIVISYIGMKTQEINVKGKNRINIVLEDDAKTLDEVVVIGYGTAKRKDITGSVASVNSDVIAAVPVSSAIEAISGRLAGVQITTTEGSPDAEMKIRVRGGGSITGDNTPLFIVDGFPVESISDIAPSDIESIDVLKDASSTAIYGSRGANGVIIVTTKGGKEGKISVNYNAYYSFKKLAKKLDVLSASDYVKWQYELDLLTNGNDDNYTKFFGNYQDMDLYDNVETNDWQDQVFGRTGETFNHNLNISGGTEKTKFAFGYSHIDDKAIMQSSNFKRDNLSLKLTNKPQKRITLDFSMRYSKTKINGGGANEQNEVSSADSRLKYAMIYPVFPINGLTEEGVDDPDFKLYNPLEAISDNDRTQERKTLNMAGSASWEIIDNLSLKAEVGLDDYRNGDSRFYGMTTYYIQNVPSSANQDHPAVILTNTSRESLRSTNTLNYNFKKLLKNDNHHLNILLGHEYIITREKILTNTIHGFPTTFTSADAFNLTTQGTPFSTDNYSNPDDKLLSFFGRLNYDYQSKYLVSATFRADGSSKFSSSNYWGYFPSAALAWRVSSESFMESTKDWLDDLKLRFSYGTAGNNNIPSGQIKQSFSSKATSWINGFNSYWAASKTMANPDLKWETTTTRNLGLDFTLLGGRLNGTIEAYLNDTKDLLIEFPVGGTGYDTQYRNMGKTENKGLEASINYIALNKKDYGLSFSANIGFNKNKIKSLGTMQNTGYQSTWAGTEVGPDYWVATGGSVGQMFGYVSDGRYEVSDFSGYDEATEKWILKDGVTDCSAVIGTIRPGSMKLKDLSGDHAVSEGNEDRKIIGDANPLHTGGFTINGRLYGFDIAANFNWSYGNDIYNANKIEYTSSSKYQYRNMISTMADGKRWTNLRADGTISNDAAELTAMNANTTMWSPSMKKYVFSDWAVEDGSFLRLNTLTLGYTLPKALTTKVKIQNLRFYVTGYNLFCWTNYSGFDPEVSTRRKTALTPGVDYSAYPKSRQFVVGLNLNF
ncbi:TonB-dependent receptor [uncultured Bacteroides sp.]|uniref:SusC/RagA family TonB-linked outer membrane protein n=1 Tax=uncultured Bacteroides sp. TaxID=162156 RepID=UPI002AA6F0AD|nr:TonB-dependent receptor [uncultured Bacteroides sp.]